jgi:hypothetical protein
MPIGLTPDSVRCSAGSMSCGEISTQGKHLSHPKHVRLVGEMDMAHGWFTVGDYSFQPYKSHADMVYKCPGEWRPESR